MKNRLLLNTIFSIAIALVCLSELNAQKLRSRSFDSKTGAYFRGASVVNDRIAWVAGTKGSVGRTWNGGESWLFHTVVNFETSDFRTVYAFDSLNVVIANAGSPAYILRTNDAGANWKVVYTNNDAKAFIDGVDFWNEKEGIMYGDPLSGKMLLLQTKDGGHTWKELPASARPALSEGEASFAASGTGIQCLDNSKVIVATGGTVSRLWVSEDKGSSWRPYEVPVVQGGKMTGIYSLAFKDSKRGIVVGGDYEKPASSEKHVFLTDDGGATWTQPKVPTRGYRECVAYVTDNILLAAGTLGIDISTDGGLTWKPFSNERQFSVVKKARNGSLVLLTGGKGRVSLIQGF